MILITLSVEEYVFSSRFGAAAHPASRTPAKSKLYLDSSLETVIRERAL
jgi:hypothetical protein